MRRHGRATACVTRTGIKEMLDTLGHLYIWLKGTNLEVASCQHTQPYLPLASSESREVSRRSARGYRAAVCVHFDTQSGCFYGDEGYFETFVWLSVRPAVCGMFEIPGSPTVNDKFTRAGEGGERER